MERSTNRSFFRVRGIVGLHVERIGQERWELVEREIEVGLRNWQFAEVSAGLDGGERIVVALDRLDIVAGVRAIPDEESAAAEPDVAAGVGS